MSISAIQTNEPNNKVKYTSAAVGGALAGIGARYVVPTKSEAKGFFNKGNIDEFVKSTSASKRANNRSSLKYGTIGAAIVAGIAFIANKIKSAKQNETQEYSKLGILLDAPDYAYSIYCYGDN